MVAEVYSDQELQSLRRFPEIGREKLVRLVDQRSKFCRPVGKPADAETALEQVQEDLRTALGELEQSLTAGDGLVRLDEQGELVDSPARRMTSRPKRWSARSSRPACLPSSAATKPQCSLKAELTEMLPFSPIVSLLFEIDQRTGLLDCFTHAGGKQTRTPELKRNLIAVLLAHATNLGLTRMADACGNSYDTLAWTAE